MLHLCLSVLSLSISPSLSVFSLSFIHSQTPQCYKEPTVTNSVADRLSCHQLESRAALLRIWSTMEGYFFPAEEFKYFLFWQQKNNLTSKTHNKLFILYLFDQDTNLCCHTDGLKNSLHSNISIKTWPSSHKDTDAYVCFLLKLVCECVSLYTN